MVAVTFRQVHPVAAVMATAGLVVAALSGTVARASAPAPPPPPPPGNVAVTIPELAFGATDDTFLVGPYRSRLHVLFNDGGLADPTTLQLLDAGGRVVPVVNVPHLGQFRVADGYVVVSPVPGAHGTANLSYRASASDRPGQVSLARVDLVPRVIAATDDTATASSVLPVPVDVAANDLILVPGAERACAPALFAHRPPPADPLPVVLPEPARQGLDCPARRPLVTREGTWMVDGAGRVVLTPSAGFAGTATAYYRQATDHPFDLGTARVMVRVEAAPGQVVEPPAPRTPVPPAPDSGTPAAGVAVLGARSGADGTDGSGRGGLASTGAAVGAAVTAGLLLTGAGLLLRRASRRRGATPPGEPAGGHDSERRA